MLDKVRIMSSRQTLGTMWLAFAVIFCVLALFHWHASGQSAPEFTPPERPMKTGSVQVLGMDIDQPIREFTKSFNEYVRSQNESSKKQNIASAFGYVIAV